MHNLAQILKREQAEILADWTAAQQAEPGVRNRVPVAEMREQGRLFLEVLGNTMQAAPEDGFGPEWQPVRDMLADLSRERAHQRFTSLETAAFVFSLRQPLLARVHNRFESDVAALGEETRKATSLIDRLGLYTLEVHQKSREEVISRQQHELLELSTPVVQLWEGILALPVIGTLDSERSQVLMENLLEQIVNRGAGIAIIDITGVPTVDTLVAQHLLKTVAAARLMGADCIISGIRPQIAQTIVHLGIELANVATKATLADAFALALRRNGLTVTRQEAAH